MVTKLEKHYLAAATAMSGRRLAALVPGVGTMIAVSMVAAETALFRDDGGVRPGGRRGTASPSPTGNALHGGPRRAGRRRRQHAVARLLGGGRTNGAWLSEGPPAPPVLALAEVNGKLMRYFLKKYTLKKSAMVAGKGLARRHRGRRRRGRQTT